jgi:hypothetical protein
MVAIRDSGPAQHNTAQHTMTQAMSVWVGVACLWLQLLDMHYRQCASNYLTPRCQQCDLHVQKDATGRHVWTRKEQQRLT